MVQSMGFMLAQSVASDHPAVTAKFILEGWLPDKARIAQSSAHARLQTQC